MDDNSTWLEMTVLLQDENIRDFWYDWLIKDMSFKGLDKPICENSSAEFGL